MNKCLTCKYEFENYYQLRVIWSGDTLPCCPRCGISVYEGRFENLKNKNKINEVIQNEYQNYRLRKSH